MRRTTSLTLAGAVTAGALLLVGCTSNEPVPAPTTPSSGSSSSPAVGGDPATWAPVEINPLNEQTTPIVMVPNQRAIFVGLEDGKAYKVLSQDATVVEPVNPSGSGGNATRAGIIALKPGTSVIQLELDGTTVYNPVTIEVTAAPPAAS